MQAVKTQTTAPRKSSMMERLRRLHSGLKVADSNTTTKPTSRKPLSFIFTLHTTTTKSGAIVVDQRQQHRPSAPSKYRSRHDEYALDLEQLDSKLEQLALSDRNSEEHEDDGVAVLAPQSICNGEEKEKEQSGTVSRQTGSDIEIVVHPPIEEVENEDGALEAEPPLPHVSDFDIFLQQAAEDERKRAESEPKSAKKQQPQQRQQLNQFYSNDWAVPSSPSPPSSKPKLAEIHEDGDKNDNDKHQGAIPSNVAPVCEKKQQDQPQSATISSRGLAILSSATTRSISPDLAETPGRRPVHTQTWPCAPVTRHVSFQEPAKAIRGRARSNPNLSRAARCAESPQGRRAFAGRKSIRRAITDYVRQLA